MTAKRNPVIGWCTCVICGLEDALVSQERQTELLYYNCEACKCVRTKGPAFQAAIQSTFVSKNIVNGPVLMEPEPVTEAVTEIIQAIPEPTPAPEPDPEPDPETVYPNAPGRIGENEKPQKPGWFGDL